MPIDWNKVLGGRFEQIDNIPDKKLFLVKGKFHNCETLSKILDLKIRKKSLLISDVPYRISSAWLREKETWTFVFRPEEDYQNG